MKWNLPPDRIVPSHALIQAAGSELVATLLTQRGITDPATAVPFLDENHYVPASSSTLPDLDRGVDRLQQALRSNERICVWGDFDVDGQTSTTLLVTALQQLGGDVIYHIPVRAKESHGIHPNVLGEYLKQGIRLLLTCDTGITAVESVDLAKKADVDVIITDHHDIPEHLPDAYACINPKFLNESHPLATLPGVGVAFKLIENLFQRQGLEHRLEPYLDLVALGIVADIAIQRHDTRFLLQKGLHVLRHTDRAGLQALKKNANIEESTFIEEDIGFRLGPRLNAVGRLADANIAVQLLSTDNTGEANSIADRLERLNEDRKLLTDQVYQAALVQIDKRPSLLQYAVLVLAHPSWHQGVIGIVASRLVEKFGKPAILLANPEGQPARGSARSVEGCHITAAIATQRDLLQGFGGHPMAAGLSMEGRSETLERFRRGVSGAVLEQRPGQDFAPSIDIDAVFDLKGMTLELADELERLAPFGPGNPPVNLLVKDVFVKKSDVIGQDGKHRRMTISDRTGTEREVLWWNSRDENIPGESIDLILRIRPGVFNGRRQANLTWIDHRPASVGKIDIRTEKKVRVVDLRLVDNPDRELRAILSHTPDVQVWGEVVRLPDIDIKRRDVLIKSESLAVWTCPPSQKVLDEVLQTVLPETIYVFAIDPEIDEKVAFTRRLLGIVKHVLQAHEGSISLTQLAALLGHEVSTVAAGLPSLNPYGIRAEMDENQHIRFIQDIPSQEAQDESLLQELLQETFAFRSFFRSTNQLEQFIKL